MVNFGFILLPLYIYPSPGAWSPLFKAAKTYPNVTFYAVINPWNGPGAGACPDANFMIAMNQLNAIPNINALGYVHTAYEYDCGSSGTDICTCSAPLEELKANITRCPKARDIHVDGIFIDEAPSNTSCESYMRSATSLAKSVLTQGNSVLFNAGTSVSDVYWSIADYINVFENTGAVYKRTKVAGLDENGQYSKQATLLVYGYGGSARALRNDVNTILSVQKDAIAGLYMSNRNVYTAFPTNWATFVKAVAEVVKANKGW